MLLSRRLFICAPLALAACGYRPVNAPGAGGRSLQRRITAETPVTSDEFLFFQQVERRVGRGTEADYRLNYSVALDVSALAISVAGAQNRFQILGRVTFALVEDESGAVVLSDTITDFTSYSAAGTTIATFAAEQDARERLMITLADQVVSRVQAAAPA
ncbi:MAG: LPS assembly lipoprotein LptE [Roseobacter sp.]